MDSTYIRKQLEDCKTVRTEALEALNKEAPVSEASKHKATTDGINRATIAVTFLAEAMLGVQLEGTIMREAMAEAHENGVQFDPSKAQSNMKEKQSGIEENTNQSGA